MSLSSPNFVRLVMPRRPHVRWLPSEAWVGETANLGNALILCGPAMTPIAGWQPSLPDDGLWLPSLS